MGKGKFPEGIFFCEYSELHPIPLKRNGGKMCQISLELIEEEK
jgi:hypothetical protein